MVQVINAPLAAPATPWHAGANCGELKSMRICPDAAGTTSGFWPGRKRRRSRLAPVAASFHPMLLEFFPAERIRGLPIHITHGALDWMFTAKSARDTADALGAMGANVTYSEIADLSHTYPSSEEHGQIYDWFMREG